MEKELKVETERLNQLLTDSMPPQILQSIEAGNVVMPSEFFFSFTLT